MNTIFCRVRPLWSPYRQMYFSTNLLTYLLVVLLSHLGRPQGCDLHFKTRINTIKKAFPNFGKAFCCLKIFINREFLVLFIRHYACFLVISNTFFKEISFILKSYHFHKSKRISSVIMLWKSQRI